MEIQAANHVKKREWALAVDHYNKLLQKQNNTEQHVLTYILDRSECLYHLGQHEIVINDCKQILKTFNGKYNTVNEPRTRIQLIRSLFALNRLTEAEMIIKDWLMIVKQLNEIGEEKMSLENALERFFALNSRQSLDLWLNNLDKSFSRTNLIRKLEKNHQGTVFCIYCNLWFRDKSELMSHCLTQEHEAMIMSDEGRDWCWRAPPRGFKSDSYMICENWKETGTCRFGVQCVEAHGEAELLEWKERFQYREMKMMRAKEKELYGKSYTEELLEKWIQSTNSKSVMDDKIDGVEDDCSCPISATVSSKNSNHEWKFTMKSRKSLRAVALLQDTHRNHFFVSSIAMGNQEYPIQNNQEFISNVDHNSTIVVYTIVVVFQTTIFGTFRQSVVFDFGSEPVLVKHLCVDVVPDSDIERINEIRKEITVSISERWTTSNSEVVPFSSTLVSFGGPNPQWEKNIKLAYPYPQVESFVLSNATVSEKKLTRNNYRERMHELLFVEEIARYNLISQYNLTTRLQIAHSYLLSPNSMAASTAKYSGNGELFASVCLTKELSEDTAEGRLILMHCNSVYLLPTESQQPRRVYEAIIEDKGKDMIYLRLSADTVRDLNLTTDADLEVQIQFQLNRVPYCEWHYTIDRIRNYKLIFPDIYVEPSIPWSPSRQWSSSLDARLNLKQKEAVVAITTPSFVKIPPILVIGPFGTGKTFTLAQAIKELIRDERNKILLCTHSNSAADLYIKDYLDVWVESGLETARPLRIYYQKRWVATVSPVVQKYCMIKTSSGGNVREFQLPTYDDIDCHKIIVVTLSTSVYLSAMNLPPDTFTHILLDEAAQALECETITPLALATENTRIVLAGDHMQLGPDIFSKFAKDRNLHISLLERLYDHYPSQFPCKILLCENYRAHETIIQFTSESFYDQKLVSSSKQPKHFRFYPLTFFTTRGEDVQDKNSTAFYNNSEVYEVVERVVELQRNWPSEWGEINEQSIGVVTPYSDQVFRIRSEFRKRKIERVCVERVLNVQGKQFRAIILSTVRTRRTCTNDKNDNDVDYGFLSNSKLLNTAITRAQSLVAVVGDPIALCSLGRCSKVWERFIQICNDNGSLYGITWNQLRFQLDGIELKKIYTLNPLAPEFIPRKYRENIRVNFTAPLPPPPQPPLFPTTFQNNIRVLPLVYQQRPQLTLPAPYVLNLPPTTTIQNGFRPPLLPLVTPPRIPPPPKSNTPAAQVAPSSTRLIQFMNNVHFPEAQMLTDCVNLLPQNMSLADMLQQPRAIQERWYNYLRESCGQEAAEKFKYLLHTTNQKGSRVPDSNVLGRSTPHSSSDSPTFNWYDSPSNQINFNKPIYMKETDSSTNWPDFSKSNPLYKRYATQQQNRTKESVDVQRHINEDFANLSINNSSTTDDWYEVFKSFNGESHSRVQNGTWSGSNRAGFYQHFA